MFSFYNSVFPLPDKYLQLAKYFFYKIIMLHFNWKLRTQYNKDKSFTNAVNCFFHFPNKDTTTTKITYFDNSVNILLSITQYYCYNYIQTYIQLPLLINTNIYVTLRDNIDGDLNNYCRNIYIILDINNKNSFDNQEETAAQP